MPIFWGLLLVVVGTALFSGGVHEDRLELKTAGLVVLAFGAFLLGSVAAAL